MSEAEQPRRCVGCGEEAPVTETIHTLIGKKHAWRVVKSYDAEGKLVLEWYCPTCWRERAKRIETTGANKK